MKRKLFWALIAILAIGVTFVGCPPEPGPGPGPGTQYVTVTFELGTAGGQTVSGTPPTAQKIVKGAGINVPPAPTPPPDGFIFTGWVNKATQAAVDSSTKFNANTTVVAKWQAFNPDTQATVKFYTNTTEAEQPTTVTGLQEFLAATPYATKIVDKDEAIGAAAFPADPSKTDYVFDGWMAVPAAEMDAIEDFAELEGLSYINDFDDETTVTEDLYVLARWNDAIKPDYGTNLVTEAAILAATGTGGTAVTKVSEGVYSVSGTVTAYSNWNGSISDNRIVLNIQADPADADAYFAGANRYGITITFPNSEVKPIEEYTEGFQIYLENTKATDNTAIWAGTWKHEWPDEYNEIGGVGNMTINRDLAEPAESDEVGDYQHLVIVLKFDDPDLGEEYTFTISDVAVYGDSVEHFAGPETPVIHGDSKLDDASYALGATAADLEVTATWTSNSSSYTYQWYSNTTNSNTGGSIIEDETEATFTPPTAADGTVYYYCVVTYPAEATSATTRAVKITVIGPRSFTLNLPCNQYSSPVNWVGCQALMTPTSHAWLFNGAAIAAGDIYEVAFDVVSDYAVSKLEIFLVDNNPAAPINYWKELFPFFDVGAVGTTTPTHVSVTMIATDAASGPQFSNFGFSTDEDRGGQGSADIVLTISNFTFIKTGTASQIEVTFDANGGTPTPSPVTIYEGSALGTKLPNVTREFYALAGWFTAASGGTEVEADTPIRNTVELVARWTYVGGTPTVVDANTLRHENPLFVAGTSFNGTIVESTVTVTGTANYGYQFPAGYNIETYDYFVVNLSLETGGQGEANRVYIRQYNTNTAYGGGGPSPKDNWLQNFTTSGTGPGKFVQEVGGAGSTGGFTINNGNNASYTLKIDSITFYKAPRYTVTFDWGFTEGAPATPAPVTNIWGWTADHPGSSLGANLPSPPDRESEATPMYFVGWFNDETPPALVTAATYITGDWTLTVEWTDVPDPRWAESISSVATSAPAYGFNLGAIGDPGDDDYAPATTLADYDRIILKLKVNASLGSAQRRLRAWGRFLKTNWTGTNLNADMANGGTTGLLTNNGATGSSANDNIQNIVTPEAGWVEVTMLLDNRTSAANWNNNLSATDVILLTIGIIPAGGQSGNSAYLVKDIRLTNEDGTKVREALHPKDDLLWGATNWARYGRGTNSNTGDVVTREIITYQED